MATTKTAAKAAKTTKTDKAPAGPSENVLKVLRAFRKRGAVSPQTAVEANKVIEGFGPNADFDIGNTIYGLRHAETPLLERADIEGKRKATYVTKAGLKLIS